MPMNLYNKDDAVFSDDHLRQAIIRSSKPLPIGATWADRDDFVVSFPRFASMIFGIFLWINLP